MIKIPVIEQLIKKVEDVPYEKFFIEIVEEHREEFEDYNLKQLEEGKRSDGEPIVPEYKSKEYANAKRYINSNPQRSLMTPDLKVSGDFYRGVTLTRQGKEFVYDSTDEKTPFLEGKYKKIFGLNDESKMLARKDILFDNMREKIGKYFGII